MNFLILLLNACGVHQDSPPPSDSSDTPPSTTGTTTYQDTQTKYDPDGDTYFEVDNAKALLAALAKGSIIKDSVSADVLAHAQSAADEKLIDCNEQDSAVHPEIPEVCDGVDNNCDGLVDDPSSKDAKTFYADSDGDTFGSSSDTTLACEQPADYVSNSTDCNDVDNTVYPNAPESCDGVDHDCNGKVDENNSVDATTWYKDTDGNGYGDVSTAIKSCDDPSSRGVTYVTQGEMSLGSANKKLDGQYIYEQFGYALSDVGDVDGDDIPDLAVGAPALYNSSVYGPGGAYIFSGANYGQWDPSTAVYIGGITSGDDTGADVSKGAGDVNGDGINDVMIGAPYESTNGNDAGATYLFFGPVTTSQSAANADVIVYGENEWDRSGYSIMPVGDINGDGVDDIAIPAFNTGDHSNGSVYIFYGASTLGGVYDLNASDITLRGADYSGLGVSVAAADFDSDGSSDLAIGAPSDINYNQYGKTYVFTNVSSLDGVNDTTVAHDVFTSATKSDEAGSSLISKGDVTGDGKPDLIIGAHYATCTYDAGALYIVSDPLVNATLSSAVGAQICGDGDLGWLTNSMDIVDWNSDGINDLLVGQTGTSNAHLFFGPILGALSIYNSDFMFTEESRNNDDIGGAVTFFTDVTGDSKPELVVSDPPYQGPYGHDGKVYVVESETLSR